MRICSGDHEPPHIHAGKPGHWSVKVYFLEQRENMIRFKRPPKAHMRKTDREKILENTEANRNALLQEWEACQGQ